MLALMDSLISVNINQLLVSLAFNNFDWFDILVCIIQNQSSEKILFSSMIPLISSLPVIKSLEYMTPENYHRVEAPKVLIIRSLLILD